MKIQKIFCTICGEKLQKYKKGTYDSFTGKPEYSLGCMNLKCRRGCFNNGGHEYNWLGTICKRCRHCYITI